ncbi:MAG: CBS domain-containing protein [Rubrobacter sp.]|nr:CBS domain-containing protein [Rubrobacter sp.]
MLLMRDLMTREVFTLGPEATAADALAVCEEHRIRHIPVVEGGRLVGLLSDRDLRDASPALQEPGGPPQIEVLKQLRVSDVMTRDPITVHPQDLVGFAAQEMYERKIDALPVVSEEPGSSGQELLGIVTSTDVMRALVTLTGVHESGSQIQVKAPDREGILAEVAEEVRHLGANIVSVLSSPEKKFGDRTMIFRLSVEDPSTIVQSLEMAGYTAAWITIPRRPRK